MNSNMKRIIASFLLVILAFIVQTCIFPLLPFLAVYPNLMVNEVSVSNALPR